MELALSAVDVVAFPDDDDDDDGKECCLAKDKEGKVGRLVCELTACADSDLGSFNGG